MLSSMALRYGNGSVAADAGKAGAARAAAVSVAWLPKGDASYGMFKEVVEAATDFSWLGANDRILVKLALNSGNPFPATTDPWALDCLLRLLKERGAGRIHVGDQSGVRNVFWNAEGQVRGASRNFGQTAGLLPVIERHGAEPVFFEELGYDAYIETVPEGAHHWKEPLRVTSFVGQVDHIVYLPRVASHMLADFTCGLKTAVGFLREDSRKALHQSGADFYSMFEEIQEVPEIKSKVRLTVSSGRKLMSLGGPDAGYVVEPDPAPVFASEDLLAHDLFAYAFIQYCRENHTPADASDPALGNLWDLMKARAARNRMFMNIVWNVGEDAVPALPVFQPGDIYRHPAILNRIARGARHEVEFQVLELNRNGDADAGRYLRRMLEL